MARMKFGGKIELAILALTLAVQLTKMIREKRAKKALVKEPVGGTRTIRIDE